MADFSALKTSIQNYIKQNGNEEITGNLLQQILLSMVSTLGDSAINDLVTALNNEVSARQNADGTLQTNINNEATARGNADATLQENIDSEATARGNADTELGGRITTLQGVVNGIIANVENGYVYAGVATPSSTPASGKVFYLALTAGTYTNFGATVVPQGINILKYNGSAWSLDTFIGLDDAPTQGSGNFVKSGGVLDSIIKDGSAFDLSAYNSGATYADLSAALTALNALPAAYKKGGMSMKFVLTSNNKYVQYRLMSDSFNTTEANWQGVDDAPTQNSPNLVKSGGVYSNNSWNLDEQEDFNIIDKKGRKGFSVGKDGVKARAYNIVDENGNITDTIGNYDKLGDGGFFQEGKGTYYFPSSISSSGSGLSCAVVGNEAKFEKSIKAEVSGVTPTSDTSFTNRGSLILNFDNPIKVKETLSVWYFVPTKFWKTDYRGGDSNVCLDNFHLYFYNGDTQIYHQYISLYEYHCGWNLFKFLTDDLVNATITKVEVRFYSYNNHPNFVCYLGHFVADQRMTPILNFNMDGSLDGITYTSGFAQWLMNNNIPVDLRLYGFGNYEEGEDEWKTITRKMYFTGLANGMTYSGEAKNYTLQQAVTYLKTGDVLHGREAALYDIPAVRDIILCGAANNFVDDELLLAAKLAGYKMIRDSNAYVYTSYIDSQCCVMPTYGVCPIRDVSLSGDELDAAIATEVSAAKAIIDNIIKYGMATSMFTHQAASKTQQGQSGFNTLGSYAEGVEEVLSYALQKQSEGKLLLKSMYNIINNN